MSRANRGQRRLEEVVARASPNKRVDEKPFEAVEAVSDFNQRAYELFAQPLVQAMSNEYTAKLGREFHPLRFQRWAFSDQNPWLACLKPAAAMGMTTIKVGQPEPAIAELEAALGIPLR